MKPAPYEKPKLLGGVNAGTATVSRNMTPTFFANVTRATQLTSFVLMGRARIDASMPRLRISAVSPAVKMRLAKPVLGPRSCCQIKAGLVVLLTGGVIA